MLRYHRILVIVGTIMVLVYKAEAFWWGASEKSSTALPYYYYQQRYLQGPPPSYQPPPVDPQGIPAIPMHVPLRAHLAPAPAIQNVQLVPCLCPVSQDPEVEKQLEQDNLYLKPVGVNSVKNP